MASVNGRLDKRFRIANKKKVKSKEDGMLDLIGDSY